MSDNQNAQGILDFIQHISSNRQSGQLEIISSGSRGALLFNDGKLVDATLGSLTGFQAVNAAASLRDVQFSFNPLLSVPRSGSIAPAERVVLKRFFGIETAEIDEVDDGVEPEIDWNVTPHQVVPLTEVDDIDPNDLQETPTVEVQRVTKRSSFLRLPVAVSLVLLLVMVAGAIVLIPKLRARRQSAAVASAVAEQPSSAPELPVVEVKKESLRDLSGEWRVINTVKKTAYKDFDNMEIGFRLKIEQTGNDFTARGEKVSENGRSLPAGSRTPIRVTGSIDGDKVVASFVEDGAMRKTNGRFVWRLQQENAALTGTFVSAAANSSGKSAGTRVNTY